MAELEEGYTDPFSPQVAPGLSLITLMRLYDVGMAILNHLDSEAAAKLYNIHANGGIVGTLPTINLGEDNE